ncbi:hypothetical protein Tco_0359292 [Tanacetum coccineum]
MPTLLPVASVAMLDAYYALYDAQQEVACIMLASMSPDLQKTLRNYTAYDMLQELKFISQVFASSLSQTLQSTTDSEPGTASGDPMRVRISEGGLASDFLIPSTKAELRDFWPMNTPSHRHQPVTQSRTLCRERRASYRECMRTRSQARRLRQHHRQQQQVPPNLVEPPKDTMADNRNYGREFAQAAHRGIRGCNVVPEIAAANFGSSMVAINSCPRNMYSFGHDKEDPHCPHSYFNKIHL